MADVQLRFQCNYGRASTSGNISSREIYRLLAEKEIAKSTVPLAPKRELIGSSLRWFRISGLAWSLYKSVVLRRAVYGPSATERRLGTICEGKGVSISSSYDLCC